MHFTQYKGRRWITPATPSLSFSNHGAKIVKNSRSREVIRICTSNPNDILTGVNKVLALDTGVTFLTVYGYHGNVDNLTLQIIEEPCYVLTNFLRFMCEEDPINPMTISYVIHESFFLVCHLYKIFPEDKNQCLIFEDTGMSQGSISLSIKTINKMEVTSTLSESIYLVYYSLDKLYYISYSVRYGQDVLREVATKKQLNQGTNIYTGSINTTNLHISVKKNHNFMIDGNLIICIRVLKNYEFPEYKLGFEHHNSTNISYFITVPYSADLVIKVTPNLYKIWLTPIVSYKHLLPLMTFMYISCFEECANKASAVIYRLAVKEKGYAIRTPIRSHTTVLYSVKYMEMFMFYAERLSSPAVCYVIQFNTVPYSEPSNFTKVETSSIEAAFRVSLINI